MGSRYDCVRAIVSPKTTDGSLIPIPEQHVPFDQVLKLFFQPTLGNGRRDRLMSIVGHFRHEAIVGITFIYQSKLTKVVGETTVADFQRAIDFSCSGLVTRFSVTVKNSSVSEIEVCIPWHFLDHVLRNFRFSSRPRQKKISPLPDHLYKSWELPSITQIQLILRGTGETLGSPLIFLEHCSTSESEVQWSHIPQTRRYTSSWNLRELSVLFSYGCSFWIVMIIDQCLMHLETLRQGVICTIVTIRTMDYKPSLSRVLVVSPQNFY